MIESKPAPAAPEVPPPEPRASIPTVYTYEDVAAAMRVGKQTVYEWVKTGKVPSPVYIGHTARFTAEQLADIMSGVRPAGTFIPAPSPRAEVGQLGAQAKKRKRKPKAAPKGKPGRPVELVADTPAAKKLKAKKPAPKKPAALKAKVLK